MKKKLKIGSLVGEIDQCLPSMVVGIVLEIGSERAFVRELVVNESAFPYGIMDFNYDLDNLRVICS